MGLRDLLMNHGMAEGGLDLPDVLNALAKGAVLVDVRTAREYEAGHAPGARLVKLTSRNGCQRLRRTSSLTEAMFHPGALHNNPHKNISLLLIGKRDASSCVSGATYGWP